MPTPFRLRGFDYNVEPHGTIVLVRPLTPDATDWLGTYAPNDAQWFGDAAACEPRYIESLALVLNAEGFRLHFDI